MPNGGASNQKKLQDLAEPYNQQLKRILLRVLRAKLQNRQANAGVRGTTGSTRVPFKMPACFRGQGVLEGKEEQSQSAASGEKLRLGSSGRVLVHIEWVNKTPSAADARYSAGLVEKGGLSEGDAPAISPAAPPAAAGAGAGAGAPPGAKMKVTAGNKTGAAGSGAAAGPSPRKGVAQRPAPYPSTAAAAHAAAAPTPPVPTASVSLVHVAAAAAPQQPQAPTVSVNLRLPKHSWS